MIVITMGIKLVVVICALLLTQFAIVERIGCSLTLAPNTAAWLGHLTTSHSAILMIHMVIASVHREECWTRLRLAMVTATMITTPQNRLDMTLTSTAGISVCQCGKCAEATLYVKMNLILRSVMRTSLVSHGGEIQK